MHGGWAPPRGGRSRSSCHPSKRKALALALTAAAVQDEAGAPEEAGGAAATLQDTKAPTLLPTLLTAVVVQDDGADLTPLAHASTIACGDQVVGWAMGRARIGWGQRCPHPPLKRRQASAPPAPPASRHTGRLWETAKPSHIRLHMCPKQHPSSAPMKKPQRSPDGSQVRCFWQAYSTPSSCS